MKIISHMDDIITGISWVPTGLYIIVAFILVVAALVSLYDAGLITVRMIASKEFALGRDVFIALFHAITAIVLIETTIVFFRTKHLAVQTLLIAGLTEMIRHVLIYDVMTMDPLHIFSLVSIMTVLIAGIVLTKSDFAPQNTGTI
jgi:hypothetical protein